MFKDYYKILDIHRHATAQEFKSAYRAMSMKWHPDKNPGTDVTNIMQDINEAYAILKDTNKRERYNQEYDIFYAQLSFNSHKVSDNDFSKEYEYDYDIKDDILKDDIADARKYAKELVDEFLKSFKEASKAAVKGAAEKSLQYAVSWIIAGFVLAILGSIIRSCNS